MSNLPYIFVHAFLLLPHSLPCSLDLSPEILGLIYKQLAGLSKRTEKILLQTQLVAILENLLAIDVGLNTKIVRQKF